MTWSLHYIQSLMHTHTHTLTEAIWQSRQRHLIKCRVANTTQHNSLPGILGWVTKHPFNFMHFITLIWKLRWWNWSWNLNSQRNIHFAWYFSRLFVLYPRSKTAYKCVSICARECLLLHNFRCHFSSCDNMPTFRRVSKIHLYVPGVKSLKSQ